MNRIGALSPGQLLEWLKAKGHNSVVLRVSDVLELAPVDQDDLARIVVVARQSNDCMRCGSGPDSADAGDCVNCYMKTDEEARAMRRAWWQGLGSLHGGHILIPVSSLVVLTYDDLVRLQEIVGYYIEARRAKGEPSRREPCDCTKGGKPPQNGCRLCGGDGELWILLEQTEEEAALASR